MLHAGLVTVELGKNDIFLISRLINFARSTDIIMDIREHLEGDGLIEFRPYLFF